MRHGAKSVVNFELLPKPPAGRGRDNPWPQWPRIFRTDYGHTEVAAHFGQGEQHWAPLHFLLTLTVQSIDPREYCISTKEFVLDDQGKLKGLNTVRVEWTKDSSGRWKMEEIGGSEKFFPAQLVFLALGFLGPENDALKELGIKQDARSNIQTPHKKYSTNVEGVFAAGDCRRGQSLIVWGIKYVVGSPSFQANAHGIFFPARVAVLPPKSILGSAERLLAYQLLVASRLV